MALEDRQQDGAHMSTIPTEMNTDTAHTEFPGLGIPKSFGGRLVRGPLPETEEWAEDLEEQPYATPIKTSEAPHGGGCGGSGDDGGGGVQAATDYKSYIKNLTGQLQRLSDDFQSTKIDESGIEKALAALGKQANDTQVHEQHGDDEYKLIKECLDGGGKFDLRNDKLGREWSRELAADPKLRKKYDKLTRHKDKLTMRKEWLDRECQQLTIGKKHLQEWQKVDHTNGDYLNFGIVYDRKAAVEAATRHAEKCLKILDHLRRYG